MNPAHVEAVKSIKNAVANKAFLHAKKLTCVNPNDGVNHPNSFCDTALLEVLKQQHISDIVICGAMSHMCIDATTRAAFDFGFNCIVAEDACAIKNLAFKDKIINAPDVHASFMAALSGGYAEVLSTQALIKNMA